MRVLVLPLLLLAAGPAAAEFDLSFYGGWAGAPDGGVTLEGPAGAEADRPIQEGSQTGLRATWWSPGDFGLALDYSRFGLSSEEGAAEGALSFGGLDALTLGGLRRWPEALGPATPYLGAGIGLGLAEAEVEEGPGTADEVTLRGPALSWVAGASVPLSESWSLFGEYEGTYTDLQGEGEDGRSVAVEGVTNSINLGVSFSF